MYCNKDRAICGGGLGMRLAIAYSERPENEATDGFQGMWLHFQGGVHLVQVCKSIDKKVLH